MRSYVRLLLRAEKGQIDADLGGEVIEQRIASLLVQEFAAALGAGPADARQRSTGVLTCDRQ
jgi:hypothetical protein